MNSLFHRFVQPHICGQNPEIIYNLVSNQHHDKNNNIKDYCINRLFRDIENRTINEMSFYEMNSLILKPNQLFVCSAKIHFKNESNEKILDNCFDRFEVSKNIDGNNDFGICYTFFAKNYRILLKDKDLIGITIKYREQKKFIFNNQFNIFLGYLYNDRYFTWFLLIKDQNKFAIETAFEINKVGIEANIAIEETFINLLSKPYMEYCELYGMFPF